MFSPWQSAQLCSLAAVSIHTEHDHRFGKPLYNRQSVRACERAPLALVLRVDVAVLSACCDACMHAECMYVGRTA